MNRKDLLLQLEEQLERAMLKYRDSESPLYFGNGKWLFSDINPERPYYQGVKDTLRQIQILLKKEVD